MTPRTPIRVLAAAGAALLLGAVFAGSPKVPLRDFQVNFTAGDRILHGETLYRESDEHFQFKYSPFCALLYAPLALLPPATAKILWMAGIFGAVFFLTAAAARWSGWPAALGAALILFRYILRELQLGQINAVIAALFLATAMILSRDAGPGEGGRRIRGGLLAGLGGAMKPYGLIFLPYLALKRRWKAVAAAAAFLFLTVLLPAAYFGWTGNIAVHKEWIGSLTRSTPPLLVSQDNVSLLGFFSKNAGPAAVPLYAAALVLLAALMLVVIARGRRVADPIPLEAALLLLYIPMISPLGWDYTFLSALPAIALVLRHFRSFAPFTRVLLAVDLAAVGLTIYDVLGRRAYVRYMDLSLPTVCFAAVAASLIALRWKAVR